jgi:hypothetical protein
VPVSSRAWSPAWPPERVEIGEHPARPVRAESRHEANIASIPVAIDSRRARVMDAAPICEWRNFAAPRGRRSCCHGRCYRRQMNAR